MTEAIAHEELCTITVHPKGESVLGMQRVGPHRMIAVQAGVVPAHTWFDNQCIVIDRSDVSQNTQT